MAYDMIEPFGVEREDLRAGIIASTIANANRGKGKSFKPVDFMPDFSKRFAKQMSVEEMQRNLLLAMRAKKR